jgi:hypothetical protein
MKREDMSNRQILFAITITTLVAVVLLLWGNV